MAPPKSVLPGGQKVVLFEVVKELLDDNRFYDLRQGRQDRYRPVGSRVCPVFSAAFEHGNHDGVLECRRVGSSVYASIDNQVDKGGRSHPS